MWVIAGLLATAGICAAIEIPSLTAHRKDLWVFFPLVVVRNSIKYSRGLEGSYPEPIGFDRSRIATVQ
jgi:hypothetical protein